MRRLIVTFWILIINLVIQSTILQYIQIRGVIPNTSLIIIISYALLRGDIEGAATGLFAGLLQDIFFGSSIGYYSLFGMLTGFFCGKIHKNFYRENYLNPLIICTMVAFLYGNLIYITSFFFSGELRYLFYLKNIILPETVYSSVFSLVIYRILFSVNDYLEIKEKYKRRLF